MNPRRLRPGGKADVAANDGAAGMKIGAEGDALELEEHGPVFGHRWREEPAASPTLPGGGAAEVVGVEAHRSAIVQSHRDALHDRRQAGPVGGEGVGDHGTEFGFFLGEGGGEEAEEDAGDERERF